jgi:hypothetical protein
MPFPSLGTPLKQLLKFQFPLKTKIFKIVLQFKDVGNKSSSVTVTVLQVYKEVS